MVNNSTPIELANASEPATSLTSIKANHSSGSNASSVGSVWKANGAVHTSEQVLPEQFTKLHELVAT